MKLGGGWGVVGEEVGEGSGRGCDQNTLCAHMKTQGINVIIFNIRMNNYCSLANNQNA